ncbi:hypothetical protein IFM89_009009 [Coptis chinensis]|uniref:Uncharacterized protein n=1 Tax=Coptis chinensis TaxID=261450 RepID=A0A835LYZ7_9MAGN|nr:hypothetical protein IFM89_009009 [Coptis chinensis]
MLKVNKLSAGWPPWLKVSFFGEAIQGWIPLRVDSFEKLEKICVVVSRTTYAPEDIILDSAGVKVTAIVHTNMPYAYEGSAVGRWVRVAQPLHLQQGYNELALLSSSIIVPYTSSHKLISPHQTPWMGVQAKVESHGHPALGFSMMFEETQKTLSTQVELVSRNSNDMVEVKHIVTLHPDVLSSEVVMTNYRSSALELTGSLLSHLSISSPDATYAVGLEGSNKFSKPPFVSDYTIIPTVYSSNK